MSSCTLENFMSWLYEKTKIQNVLAEVGVLSILRISCSEPNVQEGNLYRTMVAPYRRGQNG
ncbi:hypothetical protein T4C_12108 [Trichinella pseudospiralis]|uniref:Uncharacterized protein n=1 Tax=Trichinella pseudospiralis TaxID=6337 RepID=A0A0V1GGR7_TRIPS|nr:hypothetical protein T4C_12108 [Trichinella pseudospiralis]